MHHVTRRDALRSILLEQCDGGLGVDWANPDAFRGRNFVGVVSRIAPYVLDREKEARTVDVEVTFANAEEMRLVMPGASADVEVIVASVESVLRLPTEAILPDKSVLVCGVGDTLVQRRIEAGIGSFTFTEVKQGVSAGDRVVLSLDRAGVVAGARIVPEAAAPSGSQSGSQSGQPGGNGSRPQ